MGRRGLRTRPSTLRSSLPPAVPTLLVFTLGAAREALRHPLLPSRHRDAELRLRRACLEATLEAGRRAGCRLEISSPSRLDVAEDVYWCRQPGATFGERLRQAIGAAFTRSKGPLIVVGADVPGLTPQHLQAALSQLDRDADTIVLGPSLDGGFYLLAAARPIDDALRSVAWCGRETRRSLTSALRSRGRGVHLLERLTDLDTPGDLDKWLRSADARTPVWAAWAQRVRQVLAALKAPCLDGRRLRPSVEAPLYRPSRAPPTLATP